MNIHLLSRRLSGALAVSLALAALGAVSPAAYAQAPGCSQGSPACAVVIAQGMGMPPPPPQSMPEPMPMPGQQSDAAKSRGLFLAMFAQHVVPGLVSGIDAWFRNKLNVPMQGGSGANLQGNSMGGNNLSAQMPGMQGMQGMQGMGGMPGMQPQPGLGGWSPPGQMPPGQFSGNPGQAQMDGQQAMPPMYPQMP